MKIAATNKIYNIDGETIVNKAYVGADLVWLPESTTPSGWVVHFHGVPDGFMSDVRFWDAGNNRYDDSWNPDGLYVFVDETSTWEEGYRPIKCRITGTPKDVPGSLVYCYDTPYAYVGLASIGTSPTEFHLFLNTADVAQIDIHGYSYVTNIEFITTDDRTWEEHIYGVSNGFVPDGTSCTWSGSAFVEDPENPGNMRVVIDGSSTWHRGYRPLGFKVTGTPQSGGGSILLENTDDDFLGYGSFDGSTSVCYSYIGVDRWDQYGYNMEYDIGTMSLSGFQTVTKIEFYNLPTWATAYRPTQVRITSPVSSPDSIDDLNLLDQDGNTILVGGSFLVEPGGVYTKNLLWVELDIMGFITDSYYGSGQISKIEFYSDSAWHDYTDIQYWGGANSSFTWYATPIWQLTTGNSVLTVKRQG